jgi:hypothetical protein
LSEPRPEPGEHDAWGKHSSGENDVNAPLLLSATDMKHADALVEFADIHPTVSEPPPPDHLEGTSLKPPVDNPTRVWKTAAFSQYPRRAAGRSPMGCTCAHRPLSIRRLGGSQRPLEGGRDGTLGPPDRSAGEHEYRQRARECRAR